jgi:hypothetical protein
MTPTDYANSQIATACWRAAQTELHSVMLAVCQVFKNRADAGWYDHDLYLNCTHWLEENPGEFPDTRDPQFQQLLAKLDNVISGAVPDKTGGAFYFVHKSQLPEQIAGTQTASIGNLIFIR